MRLNLSTHGHRLQPIGTRSLHPTYHARLAWLHERRDESLVSWLEGDPEHHDAKAAGWWLYVMAAGIADPFGGGPWVVVDGLGRHAIGVEIEERYCEIIARRLSQGVLL